MIDFSNLSLMSATLVKSGGVNETCSLRVISMSQFQETAIYVAISLPLLFFLNEN